MSKLIRNGRLSSIRKDVLDFVSSIKNDQKIIEQSLNINKAHIVMLIETAIINKNEGKKILKSLSDIDIELILRSDIEDIHLAIEEEIVNKIGYEIGGNLNLAKSRNDQVATAIRMKLRNEIINLIDVLIDLQFNMLLKSEENIETIIIGYTHLQPAQPVTFAHYLLAHYDALQRDLTRLKESYKRVNKCPMGSGALSTTSFQIKRERVAELLGFEGLVENSIDAVSTRDFIQEVLAILAITSTNISRLVEDLIIWSTLEFGMIELPDEFTFSSSIMPQKKNPDLLEVIRSRMSIVISNFIASTMIMKSLPFTYNLDFQEITPKLWESIKIVKESIEMLSQLIPMLIVKKNNSREKQLSFIASTELANMLVRNHNISFRTSHKIVGILVKKLIETGKSLKDVTPDLLEKIIKDVLKFPLKIKNEEILESIDYSSIIRLNRVKGGPSKDQVESMLNSRKNDVEESRILIEKLKNSLSEKEQLLYSRINFFLS